MGRRQRGRAWGNFAVTARRSVVEWEPDAIYSSVRMANLDHSHVVPRYLKGIGTEIGAFTTPIPGISPIYVDHFETFAGVPTAAEYYGESLSTNASGRRLLGSIMRRFQRDWR
jgi:hypothetical protein